MAIPSVSQLDSGLTGVVSRVNDDYTGAVEITPANTPLTSPLYVRALLVAVAGNVKVTMADGSIATLYCAAGVVYKVIVSQVWATGTAATGIVGLY